MDGKLDFDGSDNDQTKKKKPRGRPRIFPEGTSSTSNAAKLARKREREKRKRERTMREKQRENLLDGEDVSGNISGNSLIDGGAEYDEDGLTAAERVYVEHFLAYGNKRKARKAAGVSEKNREFGERPKLVEVIKRELEERRERFKLTSEGTLEKLQWLVNFDPALLFRHDGSPIPLNQLPIHIRYCIDGIEVEDIHEGRGEERRWVGKLIKYKYSQKIHAILAAMKHQKLLDGSGATNKDRLGELLEAFKSGPVKKVTPVLEGEVKNEPGT